ncbi:SDR family NAD(P)-dependent oxidoreductase [Curvibacter sp. RS43]|jgi:NAD(P)-dependent dehydrogenase (short-subunit alcohol dehydrogenase family)|uniref:SDR family NAD(P)-dependent oxidoreductase n=1 Tax=Curvibacter microcysteis TaxID=3026419 RepID=A0ABT5MBL4_9BURK|nr:MULTISPECIES: SDR family NAD(P)-dependent oxidoreductase [unclassified Curvibacter]MDD0811061.1 SDR family NAD(P)-dependent oxidoreductase [Curvibacter sp. RS43]MDD0813967.1 SDR family NAD(P)-dependent oxidoreductase [Curvibacter sp. HBC28]
MIQYDYEGRTAVVTGGAQGIGYAIASRLLAGGARVALWDADPQALAAAQASLSHPGQAPVLGLTVDITDLAQVQAAVARTEADSGPIAMLVHSAGIAGANAPVADYDPAEWQRVVNVNLNGSFNVNRSVVAGMVARNYGRIVNIASIAGKEGNPNAAAYSASKAGVIALTKSLGKETAQHNVAVNAITPAAAKTRIFEQMSQQHIDYMLSKIPRGRFVEVDEIAAMVAWLLSSENSFTTGAVFDLSGGRATY